MTVKRGVIKLNEDIKRYGVNVLWDKGLRKVNFIISTEDYNHYTHHLHHYVPKKVLKKYPHLEASQKLILLPYLMHMNLHGAMSNERFYEHYKYFKQDLIYNVKERGRKN